MKKIKRLSIFLCMIFVMFMASISLATNYYKNDVTPPWGKINVVNGMVTNNITYVEDQNISVQITATDDMCKQEEIKYYLTTTPITKTTVIEENSWKSLDSRKYS